MVENLFFVVVFSLSLSQMILFSHLLLNLPLLWRKGQLVNQSVNQWLYYNLYLFYGNPFFSVAFVISVSLSSSVLFFYIYAFYTFLYICLVGLFFVELSFRSGKYCLVILLLLWILYNPYTEMYKYVSAVL